MEYTKESMVLRINEHVNQILRENLYELKLNQEMTERLLSMKNELREQLKLAGCGHKLAKQYLISFVQESLLNIYHFNEITINQTFLFSKEGRDEVEYQFDIVLYLLKKKYDENALEYLIEELNNTGQVTQEGITEVKGNQITADQIRVAYKRFGRELEFVEKLEILSWKIYAFYKGLGVIDEIRDMRIDGVSGGVSGAKGDYHNVWIFYKGRSLHLSFLDYGSEEEIERIARNLCRYKQPGELSKKKGYLIHEMADQARVVIARPDFAENWVFFIRKLDSIPKSSLAELIKDENAELPIQLLSWLMKGCQITGITGMQGCGKTTLLMALVEEIPIEYTIRVLELAFELHLRERYSTRNIITFRETTSVSGFDGLEVQKKTDGSVTVIGEIANARVAAWMIESGQSGSLFTLFTHHARSTKALVYSLRNSLLREAKFQSENIALSQVLEVVRFDVHLHMSREGHRYIERISEIVPSDTRDTFQVRDLICFKNGKYVQENYISEETKREMLRWMTPVEQEEFINANI